MNGRRLIVTRNGNSAEAILPMAHSPIPEWASASFFTLLLLPLYFLALRLFPALGRGEPPPLARFQVAPHRFRMEFRAANTRHWSSFECDPASLVEFRKNRYSNGLWVHVRGQTRQTLMVGFEDDVVVAVATEVRELLWDTLGVAVGVHTDGADSQD